MAKNIMHVYVLIEHEPHTPGDSEVVVLGVYATKKAAERAERAARRAARDERPGVRQWPRDEDWDIEWLIERHEIQTEPKRTTCCENPTKIVLPGSADPSCGACGADWPEARA